ncbi:MAG: hypothetical protein OXG56_01825 [Gammaproteobacteria bacterium]|nr:hypothetical protein [Gammaproteobacteria bacterium]
MSIAVNHKPVINTLEVTRHLRESGLPEKPAEAVSQVLNGALAGTVGNLATKADLEGQLGKLEGNLKGQIGELKGDFFKYICALGFIILGGMVGLAMFAFNFLPAAGP